MWREVNRGTYVKDALYLVDETIDYEIANQPGDLTAIFGRITSPQVGEVIAIYDDLHEERNRKKGVDSLSLLKTAHIRLHSNGKQGWSGIGDGRAEADAERGNEDPDPIFLPPVRWTLYRSCSNLRRLVLGIGRYE
jgi:hypothetical protein